MEIAALPTIDYRPGEALRYLHRRRGPVVRVPIPSTPVAYLFGPEANAFVLGHDELFRWREAFQGLVPVDGETALIVSDGADHTRRRSLVRPALHRRQVAGYVETMAHAAHEALAPVWPGSVVDAYALFRDAIRRSTIRSLFGPDVAVHEEEISRLLQPLFDLTDHIQTIGLHERLTTPPWRRAMTARARLDELVLAEIERVRSASPGEGGHVLEMLVHGGDGAGSGLSDGEVRDQVVSLVAAGYETTSGAMAWSLYGLGTRPDLLAAAREEVTGVVGDGPVAAEHLPSLELVPAVVTEALRLYPPAVVTARWVASGFDWQGVHIRPGTTLLLSPYVTHRDPEVYEHPTRFRPERWLDGARRPAAEYLPFGGGGHRCIGSTMATTELTVMLTTLLARGGCTVLEQRVRPTGLAAMRPRDGLRVRVH